MRLYLSADGDVLLMPEEPQAADDFVWSGVPYRIASAEWLTWLRGNLDHAAKVKVGAAVKLHRPELLGSQSELPRNYAPPRLVGAGIRWFQSTNENGGLVSYAKSSMRWDSTGSGTATEARSITFGQ